MKSKKYELVKEDTIALIDDTLLYRIRALIDFNDVKAGDLGGYIESESNLSQSGNCWVYDNAMIVGHAKVYGDANVYDRVKVRGNAHIYENAYICNRANIYGDARVHGTSFISDTATINDNAEIIDTTINNNIHIGNRGLIESEKDYCCIINIGSRCDNTTFYRTNDNGIFVCCGCFTGSIDEFQSKVLETHKDNKYAKEYLAAITMAKIRLNNTDCKD